MVTIRAEILSDVAKREALLNAAFGVKRFRKTSEKLRRGRLAAEGLGFSAVDTQGKLIGTVRLWDIMAGSAGPALLPNPAPAATPEFAAESGATANMLIPNPAPFAPPRASPSQYQTTAKPGVSNVFACEPYRHYKQTNRFVNLDYFTLKLLGSLSLVLPSNCGPPWLGVQSRRNARSFHRTFP